MMSSFLLAVLLPPILLIAWVAVQNLWRKEFGSSQDEADVLAMRGTCGRCGCASPCQRDDGQSRMQTRRS